MATDPKTVVTEMLTAFNQRRWAAFADAYATTAAIWYPQSGERIAGRDNIRGMVEAFPAPPTFTITNVRSAADLVVVECDGDYGGDTAWKCAFVYTVHDGAVTGETAYFGAPFDAAEWRAPFRT